MGGPGHGKSFQYIGEDWQMIGCTSGFEIIRLGNGHRESLDGFQSLGQGSPEGDWVNFWLGNHLGENHWRDLNH